MQKAFCGRCFVCLLGVGWLVLGFVFCGCGTLPQVINGLGEEAVIRTSGPIPESKWNRARIWQRVRDDPATYLPVGYPKGAPREDSQGEWVVDKRDEKRFLIPHEGVDSWSRNVLFGEATKISDPRRGYKGFKRLNPLANPVGHLFPIED